jgi:hypothetical protein
MSIECPDDPQEQTSWLRSPIHLLALGVFAVCIAGALGTVVDLIQFPGRPFYESVLGGTIGLLFLLCIFSDLYVYTIPVTLILTAMIWSGFVRPRYGWLTVAGYCLMVIAWGSCLYWFPELD